MPRWTPRSAFTRGGTNGQHIRGRRQKTIFFKIRGKTSLGRMIFPTTGPVPRLKRVRVQDFQGAKVVTFNKRPCRVIDASRKKPQPEDSTSAGGDLQPTVEYQKKQRRNVIVWFNTPTEDWGKGVKIKEIPPARLAFFHAKPLTRAGSRTGYSQVKEKKGSTFLQTPQIVGGENVGGEGVSFRLACPRGPVC